MKQSIQVAIDFLEELEAIKLLEYHNKNHLSQRLIENPKEMTELQIGLIRATKSVLMPVDEQKEKK